MKGMRLKDKSSKRPSRRWQTWLAGLCLLGLTCLTASYHWVSIKGQHGLYQDAEQLPFQEYALLLGTAPQLGSQPNLYYVYRIQATARLWQAQKFHKLILSGSRRMTNTGIYDEISAMRKDLKAAGIPEEVMLEDPDAHRTRLSISQAESRFGLKKYLLISQKFHCERALLIAQALGQQAICFAAEDLSGQPLMLAREMISRLIALWEAYLDTRARRTRSSEKSNDGSESDAQSR